MKLLCHRGMWETESQKNTLMSLSLAINSGYGIETDIRDCGGELVISHDMPKEIDNIKLDDFLCIYSKLECKPLLALNIKSDGLCHSLKMILDKYGVDNYFVFDMSIPDTFGYMHLNMPFAVRLSEFEPVGLLLDKAEFVWLDAFVDEWYSLNLIDDLISKGKTIAVVSPELHNRPYIDLWRKLKNISGAGALYLCTDLIAEAQEVFDI